MAVTGSVCFVKEALHARRCEAEKLARVGAEVESLLQAMLEAAGVDTGPAGGLAEQYARLLQACYDGEIRAQRENAERLQTAEKGLDFAKGQLDRLRTQARATATALLTEVLQLRQVGYRFDGAKLANSPVPTGDVCTAPSMPAELAQLLSASAAEPSDGASSRAGIVAQARKDAAKRQAGLLMRAEQRAQREKEAFEREIAALRARCQPNDHAAGPPEPSPSQGKDPPKPPAESRVPANPPGKKTKSRRQPPPVPMGHAAAKAGLLTQAQRLAALTAAPAAARAKHLGPAAAAAEERLKMEIHDVLTAGAAALQEAKRGPAAGARPPPCRGSHPPAGGVRGGHGAYELCVEALKVRHAAEVRELQAKIADLHAKCEDATAGLEPPAKKAHGDKEVRIRDAHARASKFVEQQTRSVEAHLKLAAQREVRQEAHRQLLDNKIATLSAEAASARQSLADARAAADRWMARAEALEKRAAAVSDRGRDAAGKLQGSGLGPLDGFAGGAGEDARQRLAREEARNADLRQKLRRAHAAIERLTEALGKVPPRGNEPSTPPATGDTDLDGLRETSAYVAELEGIVQDARRLSASAGNLPPGDDLAAEKRPSNRGVHTVQAPWIGAFTADRVSGASDGSGTPENESNSIAVQTSPRAARSKTASAAPQPAQEKDAREDERRHSLESARASFALQCRIRSLASMRTTFEATPIARRLRSLPNSSAHGSIAPPPFAADFRFGSTDPPSSAQQTGSDSFPRPSADRKQSVVDTYAHIPDNTCDSRSTAPFLPAPPSPTESEKYKIAERAKLFYLVDSSPADELGSNHIDVSLITPAPLVFQNELLLHTFRVKDVSPGPRLPIVTHDTPPSLRLCTGPQSSRAVYPGAMVRGAIRLVDECPPRTRQGHIPHRSLTPTQPEGRRSVSPHSRPASRSAFSPSPPPMHHPVTLNNPHALYAREVSAYAPSMPQEHHKNVEDSNGVHRMATLLLPPAG